MGAGSSSSNKSSSNSSWAGKSQNDSQSSSAFSSSTYNGSVPSCSFSTKQDSGIKSSFADKNENSKFFSSQSTVAGSYSHKRSSSSGVSSFGSSSSTLSYWGQREKDNTVRSSYSSKSGFASSSSSSGAFGEPARKGSFLSKSDPGPGYNSDCPKVRSAWDNLSKDYSDNKSVTRASSFTHSHDYKNGTLVYKTTFYERGDGLKTIRSTLLEAPKLK